MAEINALIAENMRNVKKQLDILEIGLHELKYGKCTKSLKKMPEEPAQVQKLTAQLSAMDQINEAIEHNKPIELSLAMQMFEECNSPEENLDLRTRLSLLKKHITEQREKH
ncbi:uncharacterized protein LOC119684849 [Teleopsis dalmanni]|nr:uncharacterized protein LOC119684849 [Teleopsis dalmanni]